MISPQQLDAQFIRAVANDPAAPAIARRAAQKQIRRWRYTRRFQRGAASAPVRHRPDAADAAQPLDITLGGHPWDDRWSLELRRFFDNRLPYSWLQRVWTRQMDLGIAPSQDAAFRRHIQSGVPTV